MEELLHYCWKHRFFPAAGLRTVSGKTVEVLDPGLHNHNAGPDFFNAKLRIDGMVWVGNVEIHSRSSDWFLHGHDKDEAYDNVVLHVAGEVDCEVTTHGGRHPEQLRLTVPDDVSRHYDELRTIDSYPPCYKIVPELSRLMVHSWMSALETERLEEKTERIRRRVEHSEGSWEKAYFITLARSYGFGINGEAFEAWAESIPLHAVDHHRDNLFQVEAIFLGQAGLLSPEAMPERHRGAAEAEGYFPKLRQEYLYLQHKFRLQPIDHHLWRFLRLRPQNFPHLRIAQLAMLYHSGQAGLSRLVAAPDLKAAMQLYSTGVSPYWEEHYTFGSASRKSAKHLSKSSLNTLMINVAVPVLFAYGRHRSDDGLCDRAFSILEELKAEDNNVTRMWQGVGLTVDNAGDSQALLQLKKAYCDRRDCLRCRIGYEYLRKGVWPIVREPE